VLVNTICTSEEVIARFHNLTPRIAPRKKLLKSRVATRTGALRGDDPCIRLTLLEATVLINKSILPIGYPNNVDPFACLNWFLEIASDSFTTVKIENIEADSVRPRWNVGSRLIIHAECPFLLAGFSLTHPMNVSSAFGIGKRKYIRPNPGRRRESVGSCDAEIGTVGNLDIVAGCTIELKSAHNLDFVGFTKSERNGPFFWEKVQLFTKLKRSANEKRAMGIGIRFEESLFGPKDCPVVGGPCVSVRDRDRETFKQLFADHWAAHARDDGGVAKEIYSNNGKFGVDLYLNRRNALHGNPRFKCSCSQKVSLA
jgi:hypothetical protein